MVLDYIYLLPNFDASFFNDANTEKSEFIFPVNEQITDNIGVVFQTLLNSKNHFCLYIPLELIKDRHKFFKEETFRNIVRLLFLPNYLRIDHEIVFFTEKGSGENKNFEKLKDEFYVALGKQGIRGIQQRFPGNWLGEQRVGARGMLDGFRGRGDQDDREPGGDRTERGNQFYA